jgi:type II secretory pathway component GspD/PulD (secretin)
VKKVADLITLLDVPYPQVRIDIQVVQVSTEDIKNFRTQFGYQDKKFNIGSGNDDGSTGLLFDTSADLASSFMSYINGLIENKKASMLANPSIVTREKVRSFLSFTEALPYTSIQLLQTASGTTPIPTTDYAYLGPTLWLTTHIDPLHNTVLIHIVPTYVALLGMTSDGKPITSLHYLMQETTVKSGETIIASGFITSEELESTQRVPILGQLPIVGSFFRTKTHSKKDTEVIFMFTPTILPPI